MYFSCMKEKQQKAYRIKSNDDVLLNIVATMLVYKGVPDDLANCTSYIEIYRILEGAAAIYKNKSGKFIVGHCTFGGMPDDYGIGTIAICANDNGQVVEFENWRENENVAVFFNNSIFSPDLNIGKYSDALTEVEVSLKLNCIFSRMYPIAVASDNKTKKAIEETIAAMQNGKISTILTPDSLSQYTDGATDSGITTVNLTDVEKSSYIQYLAKYRDDLMRWFLNLYGLTGQSNAKMAQMTKDEVNASNPAEMVIPHDMLRQAQEGVKRCNDLFGWNMEVSFSECWQSRLANMDDEFKKTDEELEETDTEEVMEEVTEEAGKEEEENADN